MRQKCVCTVSSGVHEEMATSVSLLLGFKRVQGTILSTSGAVKQDVDEQVLVLFVSYDLPAYEDEIVLSAHSGNSWWR